MIPLAIGQGLLVLALFLPLPLAGNVAVLGILATLAGIFITGGNHEG